MPSFTVNDIYYKLAAMILVYRTSLLAFFLCFREILGEYCNNLRHKECCKAENLWGREDTKVMSYFQCDSGCCGKTDDQYCCETDDDSTNKALPWIIGFTLFGVLVFIPVTILLVWVFRKVCVALKDQEESRQTMRELREEMRQEGLANFGEIFATTSGRSSRPGAVVHETTHVNSGPEFPGGLRANWSSGQAAHMNTSSEFPGGLRANQSSGQAAWPSRAERPYPSRNGDYSSHHSSSRLSWRVSAPEEVILVEDPHTGPQEAFGVDWQMGYSHANVADYRQPGNDQRVTAPPPAYDDVVGDGAAKRGNAGGAYENFSVV